MFDPFAVLGLPRAYAVDLKSLEKAYFDAQRKAHPDQFLGAGLEAKEQASTRSVALNQAYVILKDPLKRAECLLGDRGDILQDPEFLTQMLEWQEQWENGTLSESMIKSQKNGLLENLEKAFEENNLSEAKKNLSRLNYLKRFKI